jgi:hypothetical protein
VTRLLTAIVVLLVATARVGAQPAERVREAGFIGKDLLVLEVDDCPKQPPQSDAEKRRHAFEHFNRGGVLYAQGDYQGAVAELVAAYCTFPNYAVLKDIGQAYERELEYEKAIAYLERFVRAVPPDARATESCQPPPDPQDEKKNVLARISVLSSLRARIRVDADPSDATVTLSISGVTKARAPAGGELLVGGGAYTMTIERPGYRTVTQENVVAEIGKPYTFFVRMQPVQGRVHVRVVPGDAKLYIDQKPMGTGSFEAELPSGRYTLLAEASDHITVQRDVEVLPERDTEIAFELPPVPEYGRKQLLGYGTVAAGVVSELLAGAQTDPAYSLLAFGSGLAGGFVGIYFGTPHDLPLGTSSLTITGSLAGGVVGGSLVATLTDHFDPSLAAPAIGGGMVIGAAASYYAGRHTNPSAGDAAIINSGAVWGAVSSSLLALSFNASTQISGGIVLSGVGIGTAGGVLLQRYFTISRGHAVLIDASGIAGLIGGLATLSLVSRADNASVKNDERTSNYALGGLITGLIVGGVLTRHLDEPKLAVRPALNKAPTAGGGSTTTFGLAGQF